MRERARERGGEEERARLRERARERERERQRERERWRATDACLVFCVEIFRTNGLSNIGKVSK